MTGCRERVFAHLHEGVRKAHFGAVDGAIAGSFDDGEKRRILRI